MLLVVYLVTSVSHDTFFFYLDWHPASSSLSSHVGSGVGRVLILTLVLIPLILVVPRRWVRIALVAILAGSVVFVFVRFMRATDAKLLYISDHPSFAFRFWALGRALPRLVYYNPFWNAGKVATYAISSGVSGLGILLWPLWRFADVTRIYTPVLGVLYIVCMPLLVAGAARWMRLRWIVALVAALLSMGVSRIFFLHALRFGTIGFLFSSMFLLPFLAGLYRVIWLDAEDLKSRIWLGVSAVFLFAWPGALCIVPPLLLACAFSWKRFTWRRLRVLSLAAVPAALILLPLVLGILLHADVSRFYRMSGGSVEHGAWTDTLVEGWGVLRRGVAGGRPLLLIFGGLGCFMLPDRRMRLWWAPLWVTFLLMAGWGDQWKPQFIFERLMIHAFLVAAIPASIWIGQVLAARRAALAPLKAFVLALFLAGSWNVARIYANGSSESYRTLSEPMALFIEWVRENTGERERVLFAGPTVHGYGAGQVALLPVLTGREMMACDYYAFSPHKVEYNFPPAEWREEGHDSILEYFRLYNVGCVATYHGNWKEYFRSHPDVYTERASFMQRTLEITVFSVEGEKSQLLVGEGSVLPAVNALEVTLDAGVEDAVLKYHWADKLRVDGEAELYPYPAGKGITFIGVKPAGSTAFRIRYTGVF